MNAAAGARMTADERREAIVFVAMQEFAVGGYAGTSTETIARRAGVSQPYLFQLFGTKKDLFVATVRDGFGRTRRFFEEAGRAARSEQADPRFILERLGLAYQDLLRDRDLLLLQLQAYAACADPEIRTVVREEFSALFRSVQDVSGAPIGGLQEWFAFGMLLNVSAAMEVSPVDGAFSMSALGGACLETT